MTVVVAYIEVQGDLVYCHYVRSGRRDVGQTDRSVHPDAAGWYENDARPTIVARCQGALVRMLQSAGNVSLVGEGSPIDKPSVLSLCLHHQQQRRRQLSSHLDQALMILIARASMIFLTVFGGARTRL